MTRLATIQRSFATLSDGQIHYAECGPSDGDVVLFLHQTPRSWAEFRDVLPIVGQRYRAIAMDTIGFGDSVVPAWKGTIERWAAVVAEFLSSLGVQTADVVGHHTGGVIAIELAAARPDLVDKLVLSSTPFTDQAFRDARLGMPSIDEVEVMADGTHLAALWQRRQSFYPGGRPDLLHAFVLDALKVLDHVEYGHTAVASYRMEDRINLVTQATLILRAMADPFASPHAPELLARLSAARIVEIEQGMVPLPDQLPLEFAGEVLAFLDGAP